MTRKRKPTTWLARSSAAEYLTFMTASTERVNDFEAARCRILGRTQICIPPELMPRLAP